MIDRWANRIVGEGVKPASQFHPNPLNYRTHPQAQRDAVTGSLSTLGWIQRVIVNRRTGNLIDGHERVMNSIQHGDQPVPYVEVDLSPEEEALALAVIDPISAMAETDAKQLDALLRECQTGDAALQELLDGLAREAGIVPGDTQLKQLEVRPPPAMSWVLIGIPTVRFGEIASGIEAIAKVPGILCETTANDG